MENIDKVFLRSSRSAALKRAALTVRMALSSWSAGDRAWPANTLGARRAAIAASIEVTTRGAKRGSALSWAPVGRVSMSVILPPPA